MAGKARHTLADNRRARGDGQDGVGFSFLDTDCLSPDDAPPRDSCCSPAEPGRLPVPARKFVTMDHDGMLPTLAFSE
jgi:hypothetical protein